MDFSIRHTLPGRLRLHIPSLIARSEHGDLILNGIAKLPTVFAVRANYACASVVIEYDDDYAEYVDNLLHQLAALSIGELVHRFEHMKANTTAISERTQRALDPCEGSWPLLLPSVTLGLSFIASPVAAIVTVPMLLYAALPTFRRAKLVWQTERRLNVDVLDTLAIGVSVAQGALVAGAVVTWLIRFGDWIRDLTAAGSKRAVRDLLEYRRRQAWVVRNDGIVSIPATDLVVGDLVVVYPGEIIPVDGEIVQGSGLIDQKTITGEGLAVPREVGNTVFAAGILELGQLRIKAVRVGSDTAAGQIARLIESAPLGDTRMQNHAERFADKLVLPTLTLAVGMAVLTRDFSRFLSLVIIDLGTGMRIAAPTAVLASITHAARMGIIIKSGAHMEKLAEIDTVVFDKTGTLSLGTPHVVEIRSFHERWPSDTILGLAVAAETHLKHPVAEALRERAAELGVDIPLCDETEYRIGFGVEGFVGANYLHVGSERFLRESGIVLDRIIDRAEIDQMGCSCLYVAIDGELVGLIAYEDRIRPESAAVIHALHEMGIKQTLMLTGDNPLVAKAVANRLGLTGHFGDLLPADKARLIQELQQAGHRVAMVGDGINDSPALSFAHVGIAMKHGADIAHEFADVVLMEDLLWKLVRAIEISRSAVGLIKQNYGIVTAMNAVAMGLALPGGLVGPEVTALISNGSAIIAGANGLRPLARQS